MLLYNKNAKQHTETQIETSRLAELVLYCTTMMNGISDRFIPNKICDRKHNESPTIRNLNLFANEELLEPNFKTFIPGATATTSINQKIHYRAQDFSQFTIKNSESLKDQFSCKKNLAEILNFHESRKVLEFVLTESNTAMYTANKKSILLKTKFGDDHIGDVKTKMAHEYQKCFSTKELSKTFVYTRELALVGPAKRKPTVLSPYRVLDAPSLRNDFYSNLIAWSPVNENVAVGMGSSVHLSSTNAGSFNILNATYLAKNNDIVTCVSFSPFKDYLLVGTKLGKIILLTQNLKYLKNNHNRDYPSILAEYKTTSNRCICCIKWYGTANPNSFLCGNEKGEVYSFMVRPVWSDSRVNEDVSMDLSDSDVLEAGLSPHQSWKEDPFALSSDTSDEDEYDNHSIRYQLAHTFIGSSEDADDTSIYSELIHRVLPVRQITPIPSESASSSNSVSQDMDEELMRLESLLMRKNSEPNKITNKNLSHREKRSIKKVYVLEKKNVFKSQTQQVCGIDITQKEDMVQVAIGGNDNCCIIWDLTTLKEPKKLFMLPHKAAVKAIAFCPWATGLLATGGGSKDRCIRFWHTGTGTLLKEVKTTGQITSLTWSARNKQIAASFGYVCPETPMLIANYSYPSMTEISKVTVPANVRVLSSVLSPDKTSICIATNDESVRFYKIWNKDEVKITEAQKSGTYCSPLIEQAEDIVDVGQLLR